MTRLAPYALAFGLLAGIGCDRWVAIDPRDASKLGGSYEASLGDKVVSVRVVDVRLLDGRLVELSGDFSLRVTLANGAVHTLRPPLVVQVTGGTVSFSSSSEPPFDVASETLAKLEATRPPGRN